MPTAAAPKALPQPVLQRPEPEPAPAPTQPVATIRSDAAAYPLERKSSRFARVAGGLRRLTGKSGMV